MIWLPIHRRKSMRFFLWPRKTSGRDLWHVLETCTTWQFPELIYCKYIRHRSWIASGVTCFIQLETPMPAKMKILLFFLIDLPISLGTILSFPHNGTRLSFPTKGALYRRARRRWTMGALYAGECPTVGGFFTKHWKTGEWGKEVIYRWKRVKGDFHSCFY